MTCIHYPRSGRQRHIDSDGIIEGRLARAGREAGCDVFADQYESAVLTLEQSTFGGKIKYVYGVGLLMCRKAGAKGSRAADLKVSACRVA